MLERNREDLVRSERGVVTVLAIYNVVEIAARRVPEAAIEGIAQLARMGCELVGFRVIPFPLRSTWTDRGSYQAVPQRANREIATQRGTDAAI